VSDGVGDSVTRVWSALTGTRFDLTSEFTVQLDISKALYAHRVNHGREVPLTERDRPDFLCEGGVVIEVKIKGGSRPRETLRQISRYCRSDRVTAVILATGRTVNMPWEILGKKIYVFPLARGSL
jgi:hypothetical protein